MKRIPSDFGVVTSRRADMAHVALRGELDMASLPELEAAVAALGDARRLVIDLRALRFFDSMGLEFLLQLDAGLRDEGGELVIVRGPRNVHRLFEVMELDGVLTMVDEPPDVPSRPAPPNPPWGH